MRAPEDAPLPAPGSAADAAFAPRDLAGLFVLSAALLALEVLQTKIFAFSLDALRIYLAIGMCMLGLGAAATLLAIFPVAPGRSRRLAALAALGAAATIPPAHWIFASHAGAIETGGAAALAVNVAMTVPYLGFGLAIALVLVAAPRVGSAYAVNLGGSALGCALVFPLLDVLGAEQLLVTIAAAAGLAGLLFAGPRPGPALLGAAWIGLVSWLAPSLFAFPPENQGQLNKVIERAAALQKRYAEHRVVAEPVFSRWDRTARVDVYDLRTTIPPFQSRISDRVDVYFFAQDASAGSSVLGLGDDLSRGREFFERTVYGAGYAPKRPSSVLVIGLGGAPDVQAALYFGARRIVGVEINQTTIDLIRKDFREFTGDPYGRPEVEIHRMDGRTFVRSSDERFDLIQLSGVDTKAVLASGSLSLNENYMYTREAMAEILERLAPGGVLSFVRFNDGDAHRLTAIAVAALRERGVDDVERCIVSIAQGDYFRAVLIRPDGFAAAELERLAAFVARNASEAPAVTIPSLDWLALRLGETMRFGYAPPPLGVAATPFFEALAERRLDAFIESAEVDYSPPTDDRPFFFLTLRPLDALRRPPWALRKLYAAVVQLGAVSAAFILLPLVVFRSRGLRTAGATRSIVHFASLGAGFMLVEIGLIHRFVLLLGHQSYAVTVVLLGILVGASAGSLLSNRLRLDVPRPLAAVFAVLIAAIALCAVALPALIDAAASAPFAARLMLSLALLVALGVALGVPFPSALRALRQDQPELVAWGIGVNGFASVVGSTLAVPVALIVGLRSLLVLGALLYAVAWLTVRRRERAAA